MKSSYLGKIDEIFQKTEVHTMNKLVIIIIVIIYAVSPIDIIPDSVPIAGYADDILAIIMALKSLAS